jgi:Tol biopolymer transport system component
MVVAKKHTFVSNRNGEYDLYKIDVDGTNEEVLLPATTKEREVPFVLSHPTKDFVAFISSRDGDVNSGNFVLDGLFIIDVINSETYKVTRSEQLQLIGWSENKLIYVAVIEGVSAGNSQRSKLISYDLDTKERTELGSSNYFNDVKLIDKTVYYAVSSYGVPQSQAKLFSIDTDGKNKKTLVEEQVWSIIRKDYTNLQFSAVDLRWYEQEIGGEVKKLRHSPGNKNQ